MDDETGGLRCGWLDTPSPRRLGAADPARAEILRRHTAAVERNVPTYLDPISGFAVFTSRFLAARGECCDSGCRHCPFVDA